MVELLTESQFKKYALFKQKRVSLLSRILQQSDGIDKQRALELLARLNKL